MKRFFVLLPLIVLLLSACSRDNVPKDIVFTVGDHYVTQKEFLDRAHFTIHPNFPQSDRNLENIFLNNLIIEKILADKFGEKSELKRSETFQAYIQGRKEQAMREQLFYKKALDTVKLDSFEIESAMALSRREYDLEFFNIYSDSAAKNLQRHIDASPQSALQIFNSMHRDQERPTWTAKWKDPDHINVHEALYSGPLDADSVLGPIKLDTDHWIIIKVVDWRQVVDFGGEEQQLRYQEVIEKLTQNRAARNWNAFTRNVMKGKEIDFERGTFKRVADLLYNLHSAQNQQQNDVLRRMYQIEDSTLTAFDLPDEETFLRQPFFTLDGETWTVGDFRTALMSHPLVYRKAALDRGRFYQEFRRAVAALVRDTFLNKIAYDMNLDQHSQVCRTAEMWSDALIATFERNRLLKELGKALPDTGGRARKSKLGKKYEAYLSDLKKEYAQQIRVDQDYFNQFDISKTQLFVTQPNVPYEVVVPGWPMFTSDNSMDYMPLQTQP